jgi:3-hydroxyacyl-[acyl-carrier-protein] dehydratase
MQLEYFRLIDRIVAIDAAARTIKAEANVPTHSTIFKEAKLRSFITPGTALIVEATLKHEGSGFAVTQAEIKRGDRVVCNAEITFRVIPFPNDEFLSKLKEVAASIALPMESPVDG